MSPFEIITHANNLRKNLGLPRKKPIGEITELVEEAGYKYLATDFDNDFSGLSKKLGPLQYLIGFNINHNWNRGFRRFTIAHELGHLSMPSHRDILDSEGTHMSRPEFQVDDTVERQADIFAINFLAPKKAAAPSVKRGSFSVDRVENLADHFGISFYAAALRFVELTDLTCMLVVSNDNGQVRYEKRAPALEDSFYEPYINRQPVSARTVTYDFLQGRTDEQEATVLLNEWYPGLDEEIEATESVVNLGYNETYLTLLTPHVDEL